MKKYYASFIALFMVLGLALAGCGTSGSEENTGGNNGGGDTSGNTVNADNIGEKTSWQIVGIDPGAGIMQNTETAIKEYGLDKWTLKSSSGAAMTAQLKRAINAKKPVIVTGWSPHWMFAKFDLKYLKDPKGAYGDKENIHTMAHKGFKDNYPNATKFFKQFKWNQDAMNAVMLKIENGMEPAKAAKEWVKANQDMVKKWTKGVKKVDGKSLTITYVAWASAVASNNVVKTVLEDLGYKVELQQLSAGAMWSAVASGDAQVTLAAWLPVTHQSYYKKYKDSVVDLGVSLKGTKLGLVVPKYVDIDSIEDLKAKK